MATSIRLAPETEQRLNFLSSQTGRTKDFYLRETIVTLFTQAYTASG